MNNPPYPPRRAAARQSARERYLSALAGEDVEPSDSVEFSRLTVGDVMSRAVVSAHEGVLFKEVARALERNHIGGVPVIDLNHRVVGVITSSDLLARLTADGPTAPRGHRLAAHVENRRKRYATIARELMTTPAITVTAETTLADAARLAARSRVRSLPVVDRAGTLIGIVTRGDLITYFLRPDAEIEREVEQEVVAQAPIRHRGRVKVEVDEGVVTLTGEVGTALAAQRLVSEAGQIDGVVDVVNDTVAEVNDAFLPLGH